MGKNTIVIIDSGITATESITNEHSSINNKNATIKDLIVVFYLMFKVF